MHLQVYIDPGEPAENYFEASARIRGVTRTQLMARVISKLLCDQLILAVLDDGNAPKPKATRKLYRRRVPGRANKRYRKADYAGTEKHGGDDGTI